MSGFLTSFWPWLLAAFAAGTLTGAFSWRPAQPGRAARWLIWFGLAFAAGLPVALWRILPGALSVYLESGLAIFAVFLAGCSFGALVRRRPMGWHETWAVGLVPAALIWLAASAAALRGHDFEAAQELGGGLEQPGEPPAQTGPSSAAENGDPAAPGGPATGEAKPVAPSASLAPGRPSRREPGAGGSGPDAPSAALPLEGELDAPSCRAALRAVLEGEKIRFGDKSPAIRRRSADVMEKLAAVLKRCPKAKFEVFVQGEDGDEELARRRARRLVDYLVRMGVERDRLEPIRRGRGLEEDRLGEDPVEFLVRRSD